jgi:periplasmic protein TonB
MSDFDSERAPSFRLWLFAGLTALVLHIGGAAVAVTQLHEVEPDDTFGAPSIEIGFEMSSPHLQPTDLPAGPNIDASVASAAQVEQRAEPKESELPKEQPAESNDPDRAVTPDGANKPREDEIKIAEVETTASVESIATEATAMPSSETIPEGPRAVAPAQGTGESAVRLRAAWQKELLAHLHRHLRYPADRFRQKAGSIVSFVLDRRGNVLSARVVKGSGDAAFDAAALDMIRRSDPVPAPPPAVADEGLSFTMPVNFKVKGKG